MAQNVMTLIPVGYVAKKKRRSEHKLPCKHPDHKKEHSSSPSLLLSLSHINMFFLSLSSMNDLVSVPPTGSFKKAVKLG